MATKKTEGKRQDYEVLSPYQCPNKKHWHKAGDTVSLLPSEAEFLKRSGKVKAKSTTSVAVKKGDE